MSVIDLLGLVYGISYLFYALMWGEKPSVRFYNKLLSNPTFINHFCCNVLITALAILLGLSGHHGAAMAFCPLIFLVLLRICNTATRFIHKRDLVIAVRGDSTRRPYRWYWDGMIFLVLLLGPFAVSISAMECFRR